MRVQVWAPRRRFWKYYALDVKGKQQRLISHQTRKVAVFLILLQMNRFWIIANYNTIVIYNIVIILLKLIL